MVRVCILFCVLGTEYSSLVFSEHELRATSCFWRVLLDFLIEPHLYLACYVPVRDTRGTYGTIGDTVGPTYYTRGRLGPTGPTSTG
jgi:hypothetical protein